MSQGGAHLRAFVVVTGPTKAARPRSAEVLAGGAVPERCAEGCVRSRSSQDFLGHMMFERLSGPLHLTEDLQKPNVISGFCGCKRSSNFQLPIPVSF